MYALNVYFILHKYNGNNLWEITCFKVTKNEVSSTSFDKTYMYESYKSNNEKETKSSVFLPSHP